MLRWLALAFLMLFALVLTLPVLSLGGSWLQFDAAARDVLSQMAQTVLPDYVLTTVLLCVAVAVGVAVVGMGTASAVTLFDFPGRRIFEWALLLPLAMPAYVVAYAYTDFLQFSGPMQVGLRDAFGWRGRVFPEIRNTPGAVWVFTFSLYPYVYLLARTALTERAAQLMEAARLLGAPLARRIREVALPLARPAVAAGVALALMETLADFGVASYFGIQTFTAGIYKAWLAMDNRSAAAQLATMLLATVALLLWLEHRAQKRMRFSTLRGHRAGSSEAQPVRLRGWRAALAVLVCVLPILFGFVLPVLFMLRPLIGGWEDLPWTAFVQWSRNSVWLAGLSAALATALALAKSSPRAWLHRPAGGVIFVFRGSPLFIQFFFAYEALVLLPRAGLDVNLGFALITVETQWLTRAWAGALLVLFLNTAAYSAQIFHGALQAIPKGDLEAADAFGMTGFARFRRVVWPTMLRLAWPSYTNEAIFLFHATTLVYFSAFPTFQQMGDALYYARYFADQTFNPFVAYPIAAAYFVMLTLALIGLFGIVNRRLNRHLPRSARARFRFRPQYIR